MRVRFRLPALTWISLGIILIILVAANRVVCFEFTHMGCFGDSRNGRALPIYLRKTASVQGCANEAARRNFTIFGVQNGRECWSGPDGEDTYDKYGLVDRCTDGMGAGWANDVYEIVAVNGSWSMWSPWEACSVTCGPGSQSRNRSCSNPPPSNGGLECSGASRETRKCGSKYCPACRSIMFEPKINPNKVLTNHVIRAHVTESDQMCRIKCYTDPDCVSYNLGPSPTPGMMICQLNDADRYQYPHHYQDRPGYSYRGIENACGSNPCITNTTCQAGFGQKQYRCV